MAKKLAEMTLRELQGARVAAIKAGDEGRELSIDPYIDTLWPGDSESSEPTECTVCNGYDDTCDFCGTCANCGRYVVTDSCPDCGCKDFSRE